MSLIERALQKAQDKLRDAPLSPVAPSRATPPPAIDPPVVEAPVFQANQQLTLPRNELRARGLLPPENFERRILNQYRRVKRSLLASAIGRDAPALQMGRSMLVTSAVPGEGKTFTSLNLALSLSLERDFSVLLVDGDVAKSELSEALGAGGKPGLLDLASDPQLTIESLAFATDQPRLFFLPSGPPRDNAPEVLGRVHLVATFRTLLERLPNCLVVMDSPPLLLTSEARSLIPCVGQILMVVKSGSTSRQFVLDAIGSIDAERPVSLLLNQFSGEEEHGDQYGYPYSGGATAG